MNILQAHELFARRSDRNIFDFEVSLHGIDVWPAAATAAVMMAGCLDDACMDDDLDDGIRHFCYVLRDSIVSSDAWKEVTCEVIEHLIVWGYQGALLAAPN